MAESNDVITSVPAASPAGDAPLPTLREYLQTMARAGASDLFITVAAPPVVKMQGSFKALSRTPLTADDTRALAYSAMHDEQVREFETTLECDMSLELPEMGRFRINVFRCAAAVALSIGLAVGVQIAQAAAQAPQARSVPSPTPKLDAAYAATFRVRSTPMAPPKVFDWCEAQRKIATMVIEARFDEHLTKEQATDPITQRFPVYIRKGEPTEYLRALVEVIDVVYDKRAETVDRKTLAGLVFTSCITTGVPGVTRATPPSVRQ